MESISWKLIETYFKDNTGPLVAHHLDSYNDFFQYGIQKIFKENNPFRFVEPSTKEGSGNSESHLYLGGRFLLVFLTFLVFILFILINPICYHKSCSSKT